MTPNIKFPLLILFLLLLISIACQSSTPSPTATPGLMASFSPPPDTQEPSTSIPTIIPFVQVTEETSSEPVFISGMIPFTSPFFLDTVAEAFVMLEDQTGFITKDHNFVFKLKSQVIGPVTLIDDETLTYHLSLPLQPNGQFSDVDNDDVDDIGVQVFAIAYWSNTWGGPFLERRDGTGWSTAYASTTTSSDLGYEITGGTLLIWSPDEKQQFPSGLGDDNLLFTGDDPIDNVPKGYSIVNMSVDPFIIHKEVNPIIDLYEGEIAVTDLSSLDYQDSFEELFKKISVEYPFTEEKLIDWDDLYKTFNPVFENISSAEEYFLANKEFSLQIPDAHIGISFNDTAGQLFFDSFGGSFGLVLIQLSDRRVIAKQVLAGYPAEETGIINGAEIIEWNNQAILTALDIVKPFFGPYSTKHHEMREKLVFLTRVQPNSEVIVKFQNPDEDQAIVASMTAQIEYESLFEAIPTFSLDELVLPVEGNMLENSDIAYLRITSFSDDYNLTAQLWDRYINNLIDTEVPAVILDLRLNGGGSSSLANDMAGYFFTKEVETMRRSYYNNLTNSFEFREHTTIISPGPKFYGGHLAVLVGPYCVSACEGFVYHLSMLGRTTIFGHFPTAGAYGEVGRGQYDLPDELSMQFPTGRSEDMDGELLIEGVGILPDQLVPITYQGILNDRDEILDAAIAYLFNLQD